MRTCTGCRAVVPQRELVRLALDGSRLVIDRSSPTVRSSRDGAAPRRLPGRGAYVHPRAVCVTKAGPAGLSRTMRGKVSAADVSRIVSEMSPTTDNSGDQPLQNAGQNDPGLEVRDTVEMPPRIKAKDDRSEDARL